jgi:uncharacterized protein DUF6493
MGMNIQDLEAAIRTGEAERCRELLAGASDSERRAAAPAALKWHSAACGRRMGEDPPADLVFPPTRAEQERVYEAASVALLGTATLSELKRLGWKALMLADGAYAALADRRPDWLSDWADWALGERSWVWPHVRRMVREGLMPCPQADAYVTAMLGHIWPNDPLELLRNDPGLLEHEVWRLFEVEGGGEDSLAARDKYQKGRAGWTSALLTLAGEGLLDRGRLLDTSLQALQRDFSQFRVGWFSRFHEALEPTPEERTARLDLYLPLLGSPIPPTVSFALKALTVIEKSGGLPGDRLLDHVAPALGAREKGTVTQALKLIERAWNKEGSLAARGVRMATEGLIHESPDIQAHVLALLEKYGDPSEPGLVGLLRDRLEGVAPSQRSRLEAWLGTPVNPTPADATAGTAPRESLDALAASLPPVLSELAGVEAARKAARLGSPDLAPLDLRSLHFPRLDPAGRLIPVSGLEELLDLYSSVLENEGPPDDVERVLEGVSRLGAERSEDWERRIAPLRKRSKSLLGRGNTSLRDDLCRLAQAWLTGEVPDPPEEAPANLLNFLSTRVLALSVCAAAGEAGPLLAAPTHAGGWIEAAVLVERVREWQSQPRQVPDLSPAARKVLGTTPEARLRFDAAQALLRLAPDGRAGALAQAGDLAGELGDAVRYALGGEGIEMGPTAALWVAAARSRAPWANDPALETRHPGLGPGAAQMPRAHIEFRQVSSEYSEETWIRPHLVTEPQIQEKAPLDLPSVLYYLELDPEYLWSRGPADQRWCATIWPVSREAWATVGAFVLIDNIDWSEAQWANRVRLEVLLEPDTHLGTMERQMLVFGLAAKEPGESSLATDIAIAAIQDGRLTALSLGETLVETLAMDAVKGARLAKTLPHVARSSPLHAGTVRLGLERGLTGAASQRPADLGALLQLLQELCVETGAAVTHPETRALLQSLPGGGKAVKLAKAVLLLSETAAAASHQAAAAGQALAGRIERAARWAGWREV